MDYLVTMTTQVPEGTSEETIAATRSREAARSRELAAQGHLKRLWRPPLQPGEWRTIGLFAAADETALEDVLTSMPLRIWRSDEILELGQHPNDPTTSLLSGGTEFLTTFTVTIPDDADPAEVAELTTNESARTRELAEEGHLVRLWMLPPTPGSWHALGLFRADHDDQLASILASLPMAKWITTESTPMSKHPNDPNRSDSIAPEKNLLTK